MLVNVRLLYILVDGLHYSLGGQVMVTINPLVLLHNLTDQELHFATETEPEQTRLPLLQYCLFVMSWWLTIHDANVNDLRHHSPL